MGSKALNTYKELPSWRGFFVEDYSPKTPNVFTDIDFDGVEDSKDNCPTVKNPDQANTNGDYLGDACQMSDQDQDGIVDFRDNCRYAANLDQKDEDNDSVGDACEILSYSNSYSLNLLQWHFRQSPYFSFSNM